MRDTSEGIRLLGHIRNQFKHAIEAGSAPATGKTASADTYLNNITESYQTLSDTIDNLASLKNKDPVVNKNRLDIVSQTQAFIQDKIIPTIGLIHAGNMSEANWQSISRTRLIRTFKQKRKETARKYAWIQ